jgi:hypothetical protein
MYQVHLAGRIKHHNCVLDYSFAALCRGCDQITAPHASPAARPAAQHACHSLVALKRQQGSGPCRPMRTLK